MRALRFAPRLLWAMALLALPGLAPEARAQSCDADHLINWPDVDPVWTICWVSPENSSGIDGSGLELTWAAYQGKQVLFRANVPVINVKYDPGGCGGSDLSFRDWGNELERFEADNVIRPGYAEPTTTPQTVCENPGTDIGSFYGVAAEKLTDRLILTTQIRAGWYRYIQTWTFHQDGRMQPTFKFTAVDNTCTTLAHYHNIYWRLDFDVEGSADDVIEEYNSGAWATLPAEAQRARSAADSRRWRVRDSVTSGAWEIWPGEMDWAADAWAVADVWALKWNNAQEDDGGATGGASGDQVHVGSYVNGESVNGQDIVMWYRGGFRHEGPADCEILGPTLAPAGVPLLSVSDASVIETEAGTTEATFTVDLSAAPGPGTVSVDWETEDHTATAPDDYVAASGTLDFLPGITTRTVSVTVNSDTELEPNETFHLVLSAPTNATLVDFEGEGTIFDSSSATPPVLIAEYDPALKVPSCLEVGVGCDSGPVGLDGRNGQGPEPNAPNTINDSCADGTSGAYHVDESNDRIVVSTVDGTILAPGKAVRVDATVWAWTTPAVDTLELYYTADASNPSWTLLATINPAVGGPQTLSATYALPTGPLQAVRARFRYQGSAGACGTDPYDDHDDLVFAVQSGAPLPIAEYDAPLKVPSCAVVGVGCDSGPSLLLGRNGQGPEPNAPNTINDSCADGTSGAYHVDESTDRITVSTVDSTNLAPGKVVRVDATVWAWTTPTVDTLEIYYAANANSPSWTLLDTLHPAVGGPQTLSATYTLPSGTLQAVRARFRYEGTAGACGTDPYDDHDDLVFAVEAGTPDGDVPVTAITAPAESATVGGTFTVTASASDNVGVTKVEFYVDGVLRSTDTTPGYTYSWDTTTFTNGSHTIYSKAYDLADNVGTSATVNVTVANQIAVFDATLGVPKCATVAASCDSGPSLLNGRDGVGPEPNQPNTINNSCADGTAGDYHVDESNDRLRVSSVNGSAFGAGVTVRVEATVWAWEDSKPVDSLDLYYAANANSPSWTFIATVVPQDPGAQVLSATYTLPAGALQAVRARYRYQGTASSCGTGNYDDHDDLVFAVQ